MIFKKKPKHKLGSVHWQTGIFFQPNPYIDELVGVSSHDIWNLEYMECEVCHYRFTTDGQPLYHHIHKCVPLPPQSVRVLLSGGGPLDNKTITINDPLPGHKIAHGNDFCEYITKTWYGQDEMIANFAKKTGESTDLVDLNPKCGQRESDSQLDIGNVS